MVTDAQIATHYTPVIYNCPAADPLYALRSSNLERVSCYACKARADVAMIVPNCLICHMEHRIALWLLNYGDVVEVFDLSVVDGEVYEEGECATWDEALAEMRKVCGSWRTYRKGFAAPGTFMEQPTADTMRAMPILKRLSP